MFRSKPGGREERPLGEHHGASDGRATDGNRRHRQWIIATRRRVPLGVRLARLSRWQRLMHPSKHFDLLRCRGRETKVRQETGSLLSLLGLVPGQPDPLSVAGMTLGSGEPPQGRSFGNAERTD